jgi:CheY-like chemotaxis protein
MHETDGSNLPPERSGFTPALMGSGLNSALVQIVSSARINALVVSKIVERCGLKAFSTGLNDALTQYRERLPGTVILDGGATNRECDDLLDALMTSACALKGRPAILFVASRPLSEEEETELGPPDAVVAKPVTPESLQPAIRRLVACLATAAPQS